MRIEVNETVEKELGRIKAEQYLFGKGHSDTIAFLVSYYQKHQTIEKLIDQKLSQIPEIIHQAFLKALKTAITNLLKESS